MKYILLFSVLIMMATVSCGVYSFSQSSLGSIKTIAIPLFDDKTTEGGLNEQITDKLSKGFLSDGTLKIAREQQADGILRGTVVSYSRDPYNYTSNEIVTEYRCQITLDVQFVNRRSDKVIWEEKGMSNWGTYTSDSESEDTGKSRAIDKLVEDIINKTVKGW